METLDYNLKHWQDKKCPPINCKKDICKCGLKKVFLPSVLGDDSIDSQIAPKNGDYCNAIVVYEANGHIYIYSKEGVPTLITSGGGGDYDEIIREIQEDLTKTEGDLAQEVLDRAAGDKTLQDEIDDMKNSPDVVDIVATYAALQAYDTSKLGDNDIIRVLADETHDGQSTYYRWDKHNNAWIYIGTTGDYYTKGQVDTLLADKQDKLTAGANVAIAQVDDDLVISATDTTYTAGTNVSISSGNVISATDTTYSDFVGTDGIDAGAAGLVPAPTTADAGKFLKADGTWDTAGGGGGPTVVQTTGTSQTDVMSQNAVTSMVFADPATMYKIKIGDGTSTSEGANGVEIGHNAAATGNSSASLGYYAKSQSQAAVSVGYYAASRGEGSIAIGDNSFAGSSNNASGAVAVGPHAIANLKGSVAVGAYSESTTAGVMDIGSTRTAYGYNSTNYRVLSGVHDGQDIHDAATVAQGNTLATTAPDTSTVGVLGQLWTDTTNMHTYQCTAISGSTYTWTQRW